MLRCRLCPGIHMHMWGDFSPVCGLRSQWAEPRGVHAPVPQFPCPVQGSSGPCCRDSHMPRLRVQHCGSCPRHDAEELIPILLATPKTTEQGELAQTFASSPFAWLYPDKFLSRLAGSCLLYPMLVAPVPITGGRARMQSARPLRLSSLPTRSIFFFFLLLLLGLLFCDPI